MLKKIALTCCVLVGHVSIPAAHAGPMATKGVATVSSLGAALYKIDVEIPPGAGTLEPKLEITYSNQGPNGILGTGWSISGLSSIGRCHRTISQDGVKGRIGFDANDRFCLDGERLVAVSGTYGANGTEYRTERDSFSKIVSYGTAGVGPAWFKVWTKSGEILEYGNTTDSRIEAQGKTSARVWALNRASDIKGNYRTVTYTEDSTNGYYYPQRIDYTGNTNTAQAPTSSVQFQYQTRDDATVLYLAGSLVKPTQRLAKIVTAVGANTVKEYRFTYDKSAVTNNSRLLSITECGASNVCLPAVSVGWTSTASSLPNVSTSKTTQSVTNNLFTRVNWLTGDVNGDGRDDLVLATTDSITNLHRRVWLADANGALSASPSGSAESSFSPNTFTSVQYALVDTNGDGRKDLVMTWTALNTFGRAVWLADVNGAFPSTYSSQSISTTYTPQTYTNLSVNYGDLNGDGRTDLVWSWKSGSTFNRLVWLADTNGAYPVNPSSQVIGESGNTAPTGLATQTLMGDVNGDGLPDLITTWYFGTTMTRVVWLTQPGGTFLSTYSTLENEAGFNNSTLYVNPQAFLTDLNGDGRMDLTWAWTYSATYDGPGRAVWLSKGDGTFGTRVAYTEETISGFNASYCNQRIQFHSLDINGDNRADLALTCSYLNNLYLITWITRPDGSLPATYTSLVLDTEYSLSTMQNDRSFMVADTNGDGKSDLTFAWRDNSSTLGRAVHRTTLGLVDQVTSINNGIGNATTFAYKPMTDTTVYTKDTGGSAAAYPTQDVQFPLYLVSSISESNDNGGTMTTNYIYGGGKTDLLGRGFIGLRTMRATQVETGLSTQSDFRMDWPYHGLKSQIIKRTASGGSGGVLETTTNTYGCTDFVSGSGCSIAVGRRYFPNLSTQTVSSWDLNGAAFPTQTTTQQYDSYGNPTYVSVSASDGYSKTITSTYLNDTTNWFIGRLTQTTTVGVAP